MSRILVCPLAHVADLVRASGAQSVVSILTEGMEPPAALSHVPRRLHLTLSDIAQATPGHRLAERPDLDRLLDFGRTWDRCAPLVIHCYAGVSRSPAAAFGLACALDPAAPEHRIAAQLRQASPCATPNARIVALADRALGRDGRMIAAIAAIGRGADCFEGDLFALECPDGSMDARPREIG